MDFNVALADSEFREENKLHFPEESMIDLDISVDKLRIKYNNLKKQWRTIVDRAKVGSGSIHFAKGVFLINFLFIFVIKKSLHCTSFLIIPTPREV